MKQWKRVSGVVLSGVLALSMTLGGMTAPDAGAKAKKAKLKTKKISVQVGKKKTIKITNKSKSCKYTFTSSKKKVAKVSKKGTVTGVKKGTAKITVKEIKKKGKGKARKLGTVKVTVTKKTSVVTKSTPTAKVTNNANNNASNSGDKKATPTPAPTEKGISVKVYSDEITEANKLAEVDGVGHMPTPTPTPATGDATPAPTAALLIDANMENGDSEPIAARGPTTLSVVDDGANGTKKSVQVSDRSSDWHGAGVGIAQMVEVGNQYQITFYAKQSTGEDSKIDLSIQYVGDDGETHYDGVGQFELPNDTWTKCEATLTVPEFTGDLLLYWQSVYQSNNFMDFYLDEVTMTGVAKADSGDSGIPDLSTGLVKGKIGNPIMTSRLTADPWAMEYNGRVYVYGTNDSQQYDAAGSADNNYSKIRTLNCYSSADMVNWTDHGTINVKGVAKWSANSWAPAACHKTINGKEKFFLYFANNASSIGVLTADSPTGPWTDPIGKALIDRSVPGCSEKEVAWLFDPAVLVDDDGTGYLYFGGIGDTNGKSEDYIRNPKCARVIKLGEDMVSVVGEAKTIDAPYMFEDSGINKIGNKYYYSYCTNWTGLSGRENCPTANIAVMVSDSPMGDFQYVGCVLKNPGSYFSGATGNNHHCLAEFKGKMYAFYHTKRDTLALGTKQDYRTTYVNELNMGDNGDFTNADGSIADTKMTTSGVGSIATLNPYETVEAETFALADTVGTVQNAETSTNTDWLTNYSVYNGKLGSYIGVADVDFGSEGASEVTLKLADSTTEGYKEITQKLSKKLTGKHTIYFEFGKLDVMMDSWVFKK